jgi:hypothetical protein
VPDLGELPPDDALQSIHFVSEIPQELMAASKRARLHASDRGCLDPSSLSFKSTWIMQNRTGKTRSPSSISKGGAETRQGQ